VTPDSAAAQAAPDAAPGGSGAPGAPGAPSASAPCAHAARGRVLVPLLIAALSLWILSYPYLHSPILPVWDAWKWIADAQAFELGGWRGYWASSPVHPDHLYALPSLIVLWTGPWFEYSMRPYALFSGVLLIALGLLLFRLARARGLGRYEALAVFAAVCSMRHHENLSTGYQFGLTLCALLGVAAVLVADARRDRTGFLLAMLLAAAALACSSAGLLACLLVGLLRWFRLDGWRRQLVVALASVAALFVVHLAVEAFAGVSFVARGLHHIESKSLVRTFLDALEVLGCAFAGHAAELPAGLALLAGGAAHLVRQLRADRRLDATSGLVLLGFGMALVVAVARSPFAMAESRYAVLTAPLLAVCVLDLLRGLRSLPDSFAGARTFGRAALVVLLVWAQASERLEAERHRRKLQDGELDARLALGAMTAEAPLDEATLATLSNGDPGFIRSLVEFTAARRWTVFSPSYRGFARQTGFPTRTQHDARLQRAGELLVLTGNGYAFEPQPCPFPSGCRARVTIEARVTGRARLGILVRRADGSERSNTATPLEAGADFQRRHHHADAQPGDTLEPYVYTYSPEDQVELRSFSTLMTQTSQVP